MSKQSHKTDVVIVGAGPVGLFAVFELGMLQIKCHVIDALGAPGGQCQALYPEKPIYDIPGYPMILAGNLVEQLEKQAEPFAPVYHLGQTVTQVTPQDGGWQVETSGGTSVTCRAVVIAAGGGAFGPNRPPLAGIEAFEGQQVHYMVGRREAFRDQTLVIAGGGDSALDWTLSLADLAKHIYLIHRRPKFRAAPESVARMERLAAPGGKVELVVPYQLDGLEGRDGKLEAVVVRSLDGGQRRLPADHLLAFFGLSMNLGPITDWGLKLEERLIPVAPASCATNLPGVFAIGDINSYPGKLKLILTGFAEAATTAHAIHPLVYPDRALHWEYSTTKGLPGSD